MGTRQEAGASPLLLSWERHRASSQEFGVLGGDSVLGVLPAKRLGRPLSGSYMPPEKEGSPLALLIVSSPSSLCLYTYVFFN